MSIVPYSHVMTLATLLFVLGVVCLVARRNLIMMLLGLEILLNAASIAFVGASLRWQHMDGQALALFIMAVAAAEVSVGLALIVAVFRRTGSVDPEVLEPEPSTRQR
jgi:NADH-quinone oxidoreductase subunit K